jgi:hypothetical protein
MKTLSIPGFISLSTLITRLLLNCFILGPLAVVYGLLAEAFLAKHPSVLFGESSAAILIIIFGGFFGSFVCMAASAVLLLPIALWELNQVNSPKQSMAIFSRYLPMPVLLSFLLIGVAWAANECKPLPPEPLAIIISFYLTASTGLYLMSQQLSSLLTKL